MVESRSDARAVNRDFIHQPPTPVVFTKKSLRTSYIHNGQPSEGFDTAGRVFKYDRIFGQFSMFGDDGLHYQLINGVVVSRSHGTSTTDFRLVPALLIGMVRTGPRKHTSSNTGIKAGCG